LLIQYTQDKKLYEYGLRRADIVLCQHAGQQRALVENYEVTSVVADPLVDPSGRQLNREKRDLEILWVSNLLAFKRSEVAIELARLVAVIVFTNHRNGIWLLTFLLPFYSSQLIPHQLFGMTGLNPLTSLFVLTLLSLFAASAFRREDIQFVSLPTTFWIYVGVMTLGAYIGVGSVERAIVLPNAEPLTKTTYLLDAFFKPLMILGVAWLAAVLSRNGKGRSVIWALAAAYVTFFIVIAGFLVTNGISLQSLADPEARSFLGWTGLHANDVGELANIGFAILLFTALATSAPRSRAILLACAGAVAMMAALTFSRAAFVGIGITLGYYVWKQRSMGRFLLALSAIAMVALLLPDAFFERASTGLATGDEQAITAGRLDEIWRPLIGTFWEAPIIGHGLSSTTWATPNLRGEMLPVGQAHSAYLDVALDLGILGIVVVAAFFWSVDADVCDCFGKQARQRVHEQFSLAPMRRNYESLLEEAAHRRRAGAA
jgi:O-antigen ligase